MAQLQIRQTNFPAEAWMWCGAVYAVLPTSFLFLVIFSFASQRFSRGQLFNFIITVFVTWFVAFGFMYPHHEV